MINVRFIRWVERHPRVGNAILSVAAISFVFAAIRLLASL